MPLAVTSMQNALEIWARLAQALLIKSASSLTRLRKAQEARCRAGLAAAARPESALRG